MHLHDNADAGASRQAPYLADTWLCGLTGIPGVGWLSDRDLSLELLGVTCKRVPQALQEENGVGLARAFRLALRLLDDLGPLG